MSQPAVTQAIGKLEEQFGAELLTRSQTGSDLTEAGRILMMRVNRLFAQINATLSELLLPLNRVSVEQVENKITSSHVRVLAALAEGSGFDEAAGVLGISKPSLQRIMREVERILHRPICQRTVHGIVLTRFGTELARRMKLATLEIEGAAEQIQAISGVIRAQMSIGIPQLANSTFLGMALSRLTHMHGEIQLFITERPREVLLQELRFGKLDIVFGTLRQTSPGKDFVEEPLFQDPYCIAVRTGHPLTELGDIMVDDLMRFKWINPKTETIRRDIYEYIFRDCADLPQIAIETSSLNMHLSLLQTSDYVALMKKEEIEMHEHFGRLTTLPFQLENMYGVVGITTRAGWHPTQAQERLVEIMRDQAKTFGRQAEAR